MLTKLTIGNFKRFEVAEVDLGKSVVLVGPNHSGKTTAGGVPDLDIGAENR